jgi:CheY-like chemotaxis protein
MPGMSGTELALHIRRSRPELPIIIATGYAELPADRDLRLPRLLKPYSQQDLALLLATLIGQCPACRPAQVPTA